MNEHFFYSKDLNFNDFSSEDLKLVCDNELLTKTCYPKLIISLYKNIELKPDTCKTPRFSSITPSKSKPRTPSTPKKR